MLDYAFLKSHLNYLLRSCSQTTLTRFWVFLTTYPPAFTFSMEKTLTKSEHFWTTFLHCLVNVACEHPLTYFMTCMIFRRLLINFHEGKISNFYEVFKLCLLAAFFTLLG